MKARRVVFWSLCVAGLYVLVGTFLHQVAFPVPAIAPSLLPRAGDSVYNHLSGERLVFRQTHTDTDGEYWEADFFLDPHGAAQGEHVHAEAEEYFRGVEGVLTLSLDGNARELLPGETVVVPPGTPHRPFNNSEQTVHVIAGGRPARHFDLCLIQTWGLFMKADQKEPGLIPLLPFLSTVDCDVFPAGIPVGVARTLRLLVAPAARVVGFSGFGPAYDARSGRHP